MSDSAALSVRAELSRKALHIATAALPVSLAFGWSDLTTLRGTLTIATALAVAIDALRLHWSPFAQRFTQAFGAMLRGRESRQFTGATWLALAMAIVLWTTPHAAAIAALWAAAVGDACAAIVGRAATPSFAAADRKSVAGSVAAAVSTGVGIVWLTPASWAVAALLGVVAAAAERPTLRIDDNLRVALAVAAAATLLGLR